MEGRTKEGSKDGRKNERKKGWAKKTHPLVYSFIGSSLPLYPFLVYCPSPIPGVYLSIFVSYLNSFFLLFLLLMEEWGEMTQRYFSLMVVERGWGCQK